MMVRALLVLLVVANLGVAAWWLARAPAAPVSAAAALPDGAVRLQLLGETGGDAKSMPASAVAADAQCVQFGPFPDDARLRHVREILGGLANGAGLKLVQIQAPPPDTWRVVIPPLPDAAQARALGARIEAAGFDDYLVIGDGNEAHSIAVGQYASRESALERQQTLGEAGFQAQVHAEGGTSRFLAVALAASADVDGLRAELAALQANPVDCATVR